LVATAVVAVDQLAKQWALSTLDRGQSFSLIGDLLSLKLVFNSGAAFSFGGEFTWILTIVAVIVTVGIVYYSRRAQSTGIEWLFGIGLGGAVGNLIDRLLRAPGFGEGHVVDMINYGDQFVGNIADIAIVGAAATAVLLGLLGKPLLMPVAAPEKHADARSGSAETSPNDVT
jgi:signal peptidase II